MTDILPSVAPDDDGPTLPEFLDQTIANWKAKMPLTYHVNVRSLFNHIEYKRGRRDFNFIFEAMERAIEGLVVLYDLVANDEERKVMREAFREIMARYDATPYPYLLAPIRTRLREHKMYVIFGLDPPDPNERRKGRAP
jgi:hypothetical protein